MTPMMDLVVSADPWNIIYNDVLNILVPEEATVVNYNHAPTLVVVAMDLEDAELYSVL